MQGPIQINLPTVDWSTLIPTLVGFFFSAIGDWLQKSLHSAFDGLWSGGGNVVGQTDLAMTWSFGPVAAQIHDVENGARAILLFAVVLLGLKAMLGGIVTRHHDALGEAVDGILVSIILVAAFPVFIPLAIGLVNQAAKAVAGGAAISTYMGASGGIDDPLIGGVLLVILFFFGVRLLIKAVWRIGFLAVLLPVGVAACALYAIPSTRWLLSWWARLWGGMLLAQIPSVFALSIGLGLFASGSGVGPFVYSIAFLQLATDLYSLIPFGGVGSSGAPWGSLPSRAAALAVGPSGAAAGASKAAAAWPAGATAGHVADMYGYQ